MLSLFYWVGLRSEIERVRLDFTREIKGFTILGSILNFLVGSGEVVDFTGILRVEIKYGRGWILKLV